MLVQGLRCLEAIEVGGGGGHPLLGPIEPDLDVFESDLLDAVGHRRSQPPHAEAVPARMENRG